MAGPNYEAFTVKEDENGKKRYTKIGACWENKSGLTIRLEAHPMGDTILLFPPRPKEDRAASKPQSDDDIPF